MSNLKIYVTQLPKNNFGMPGKSGTPAESPLRYGDKTLGIIEAFAEIITRLGACRSSQRNGFRRASRSFPAFTAYPRQRPSDIFLTLKRKNITRKFKCPLDINLEPRYIQDTP